MGYEQRKKLYHKFEKLRNRPLIVYVTSIRPNASAQMAADAITSIIEQVRKIPDEQKNLDFMIISNGGDPITALRIVSILRERFTHIAVLIPYIAYSAATILALGADEIIMHPFSNLGPVDPQLNVQKDNGMGQTGNIAFSSEDLRNYIEFVKNDVGIKDQAFLVEALKALGSEIGVLPIGSAKRSQQLSLALSSKMLETHINDKTQAMHIAQTLNSSYYHHGYAVGRSEAKELGLNIVKPEKELEELMWALWEDFRGEMKCDKAFDLMSELLGNSQIAAQITNVPVLNLPADLPQEIRGQLYNDVMQRIQIEIRTSIDIIQLMATVESSRECYQFYNKFNTIYWRNPDMSIGYNATVYNSGWEKESIGENQSQGQALMEVAATTRGER